MHCISWRPRSSKDGKEGHTAHCLHTISNTIETNKYTNKETDKQTNDQGDRQVNKRSKWSCKDGKEGHLHYTAYCLHTPHYVTIKANKQLRKISKKITTHKQSFKDGKKGHTLETAPCLQPHSLTTKTNKQTNIWTKGTHKDGKVEGPGESLSAFSMGWTPEKGWCIWSLSFFSFKCVWICISGLLPSSRWYKLTFLDSWHCWFPFEFPKLCLMLWHLLSCYMLSANNTLPPMTLVKMQQPMTAFSELFSSAQYVCVSVVIWILKLSPSQGKARAFPCYACDDPPTVVWKSEGWDSRGRQVAASRGAPLPVAGGGSRTQQLSGHKKKKLRVGGPQCDSFTGNLRWVGKNSHRSNLSHRYWSAVRGKFHV